MKPCPFCNSEALRVREEDLNPYGKNPQTVFYVICDNCETQGPQYHIEQVAVDKWNERVQS